MKVMAINGSPRKKGWNTVSMLQHALAGARAAGADTELVHLYDLNFSGCISCFSCKKIGRKQVGVCAVDDGLTPVLNAIRESRDAFIIGTPVYYGCESATTRALLERLFFPYNSYATDRHSLFPRRIKTGLIYTMNVSQDVVGKWGYDRHFEATRGQIERYFGSCELLLATETMQYSDYAKYDSEMFDAPARQKRHAEVFPQECKQAEELGARLVG